MKALLSTGFKLPKKRNIFLSLGPYKEKLEFLDSAQKLVNMGYNLFGTGYQQPSSLPIPTLTGERLTHARTTAHAHARDTGVRPIS
jgi:hypothetical protein